MSDQRREAVARALVSAAQFRIPTEGRIDFEMLSEETRAMFYTYADAALAVIDATDRQDDDLPRIPGQYKQARGIAPLVTDDTIDIGELPVVAESICLPVEPTDAEVREALDELYVALTPDLTDLGKWNIVRVALYRARQARP
jgi:hypothetical protein